MSGDRSRTRRQLAAECFALAQQTFDANLRASLVGMAQKWLDLAELGPQEHDEALFRAIRAKIGEELREQYKLPPELTHRMLTLLMQLDGQNDAD